MVPRTVTTDWCTELGTTLLNGFINTTDNPAYFRCLNSLSVHHPIRLRKFLFHWSRHAGAPLLMNLVLIRGGYPPVSVRPEDRLEYIRSLPREQGGQGADH